MPVLLLAHNTPEETVRAARRLGDKSGFGVVVMPPAHGLPTPVASHPDMLLFAGFGRIFVRDAHMAYADFKRAVRVILDCLPSHSLSLTSDIPSETYPHDIAFNCAVIGGALVGKADYISPAVKRAAAESGLPVLDTAQGYAKCSTLIMGNGADAPVVTADKSIYRTAIFRGVSAYLIPPGSVELPGYDTGFIGGASFFADGTVYFLGALDSLPSCDTIKDAAARHGVGICSLSDLPLFDAGCLYIR